MGVPTCYKGWGSDNLRLYGPEIQSHKTRVVDGHLVHAEF